MKSCDECDGLDALGESREACTVHGDLERALVAERKARMEADESRLITGRRCRSLEEQFAREIERCSEAERERDEAREALRKAEAGAAKARVMAHAIIERAGIVEKNRALLEAGEAMDGVVAFVLDQVTQPYPLMAEVVAKCRAARARWKKATGGA